MPKIETPRFNRPKSKESERPLQRDPCPFKHEMITGALAPEAKAESKAKPHAKASTGSAPTKAAVALVMALASGVSGQPVTAPGSSRITVDVIADTSPGEHLRSKSALLHQGLPESLVDRYIGSSSKPTSFETGGGKKGADETVGFWAESLHRLSNMYMLKSCPLVYSIGQFVMNQELPFIWKAGELPYLVPPHVPCHVDVDRTLCRVADRIDHCMPVFQETVELVSGLPVPVRSEDALEPPEALRKASLIDGCSDVRGSSVHH